MPVSLCAGFSIALNTEGEGVETDDTKDFGGDFIPPYTNLRDE
jgi:hypothetical protein